MQDFHAAVLVSMLRYSYHAHLILRKISSSLFL
jgi:hypothetical protein